MRRAVCPGSFDPVTRGHLDVFARAGALADEVVVAVGSNRGKGAGKNALFTPDERVSMIDSATGGAVRATVFDGLLVEFCRREDIDLIVKGLRRSADLDFELPMAQMNRHLTGIETVFVTTAPEWSYVSSSLVREVATLGGDVTAFLTDDVAARTLARIAERAR